MPKLAPSLQMAKQLSVEKRHTNVTSFNDAMFLRYKISLNTQYNILQIDSYLQSRNFSFHTFVMYIWVPSPENFTSWLVMRSK